MQNRPEKGKECDVHITVELKSITTPSSSSEQRAVSELDTQQRRDQLLNNAGFLTMESSAENNNCHKIP
jgi:hypothetical protein